MKKLPIWMTTVTPVSKIIAAVLFIALPFAGFFAGIEIGKNSVIKTNNITTNSVTTMNTVIPTIINHDRANGDTFYIPNLDISVLMPAGWKIAILNYGYQTCETLKSNYKNPTDCKGSIKQDVVFAYNDSDYTAKYDPQGVIENFPKQYFALTPFTGKQNFNTLCEARGNKCGNQYEFTMGVLKNMFVFNYEDKNYIGYSNSTTTTGDNSVYVSFQISEIKANNKAGLDTIKQIIGSIYTGK